MLVILVIFKVVFQSFALKLIVWLLGQKENVNTPTFSHFILRWGDFGFSLLPVAFLQLYGSLKFKLLSHLSRYRRYAMIRSNDVTCETVEGALITNRNHSGLFGTNC